jgi:hypothetical protein
VPAQFLEQLCFRATSTTGGWICGFRPEGASPVVAETVADAYTWNVSLKGDSYTGSGTAITRGGALPRTSVALTLEATPAAPSEGSYETTAYGIERGVAEVTYQVIVINDLGSPVASVPLVIAASGESRPGPLSGRTGPYGYAKSTARLTVEYPGADGGDAVLEEEAFACVFQNAPCYSNPSFDVFAVGEALSVRVGASAGASATVDVRVRAEAEIQGEIYVLKGYDTLVVEAASGTASSSVDPAIYIDPSWPHASLYHLEFSEGIEPAPEPWGAALSGAALAGLFAVARGRSRGGSPQHRNHRSASSS